MPENGDKNRKLLVYPTIQAASVEKRQISICKFLESTIHHTPLSALVKLDPSFLSQMMPDF